MIVLNSYLHRAELADLIDRWLHDRPHPSDAARVKAIVNYNAVLTRRYLCAFAEDLMGAVFGVRPESQPFERKAEVKDFLIAHPHTTSRRIDELIRAYRDAPECYYRETPALGRLYHAELQGRRVCLGLIRLKRFRRIAEKSSRRIVDHVFSRICAEADRFAAERAARLRIPKEQLVTPPDEMLAEFQNAERRIVEGLRHNTLTTRDVRFAINDIAGMKIVADPEAFERLLAVIGAHPRIELLEREAHRGFYNATNLTLRVTLDKERLAEPRFDADMLDLLAERGLPRDSLAADYETFVRTGEDTVLLEIIVSNYPELLESEIGRCMHEERILRQRQNQRYQGHLARNVEYLMGFLFDFARSPRAALDELPFKPWGQYIEDYVDQVRRSLYTVTVRRMPL